MSNYVGYLCLCVLGVCVLIVFGSCLFVLFVVLLDYGCSLLIWLRLFGELRWVWLVVSCCFASDWFGFCGCWCLACYCAFGLVRFVV